MLAWEGPTLLNPHFAQGAKDYFGSRIFYEPLAQWDEEGNLQAVLAAEIPSRENGGLAADGRSVVWKLKRGVTWHDGQPFTADDVVFNWQFAIDPAAATVTIGSYRNLKIEKIDSHSVRVVFSTPSPFWPGQYSQVMLVPRHLFVPFSGAKAREATNNNRPVGTGAYSFVDFKPGDLLNASLNPNYHEANRPHFDTLELKGGGDATSAARAVLQTGEYDYANSLVVDDDVLKRMEAGGKGRVEFLRGSATTAIYLNCTDPGTEVDGERSSPATRHPLFSDPSVRRALGLLVDRQSIQTYIYGRQGIATGNFVNNPSRYRSASAAGEYSVDKAKVLLDAAGWKPGPDGVREKGGRKLTLLFQAATGVSQKLQAVFKQAAQRAGIQMELKAVVPSVFLLVGCGQSRNVRQVPCRFADIRLDQPQSRSRRDDAVLRFVGGVVQGEQVVGQEHRSLAEQRIRCAVPCGGRGTRQRQARRPFHPNERPGRPRRVCAARHRPHFGTCPDSPPGGALVWLAERHGVAAALVPQGLIGRVTKVRRPRVSARRMDEAPAFVVRKFDLLARRIGFADAHDEFEPAAPCLKCGNTRAGWSIAFPICRPPSAALGFRIPARPLTSRCETSTLVKAAPRRCQDPARCDPRVDQTTVVLPANRRSTSCESVTKPKHLRTFHKVASVQNRGEVVAQQSSSRMQP
jgi:peptide/nickel transport system substrate-binding protein